MIGYFRRRRGLCTAVAGDALVLGGSVPAARLRGAAATTSVPALLGALDGHRDVPELAAAVGEPERHIEAMLSLLGRFGAVESATMAADPGSAAGGFFASVAAGHADLRSGEELLAAFTDTAVEVLGEDTFAVKLRAAAGTPDRRRPADRTVVVGSAAEPLMERWRAGSPVIPVWTTGGELAIGPLIVAGSAPCPGCVIDGPPTPLPEHHHDLAAAFAAARIPVLAVTRHDGTESSRTQHVDFEAGRTRFVAKSSRPGCPDCAVPSAAVLKIGEL